MRRLDSLRYVRPVGGNKTYAFSVEVRRITFRSSGEFMKKTLSAVCAIVAMIILSLIALAESDLEKRVENGYADSGGVKIHYVSLGKGPLIVMIHGFPDFWFTWRDQMEALLKKYQVVAIA